MDNITLDTTNFSEQLGLYDFFDVIVSGAVFVFGISSLSNKVRTILWENPTILHGLGIALLIYISGTVLQELSSALDYRFIRIKHFTRSTFLFDLKKRKKIKKLQYWLSGLFAFSANYLEEVNSTHSEQTCSICSDQNGLWTSIKQMIVKKGKEGKWNWVINNQFLLDKYRKLAKKIYEEDSCDLNLDYNDEKFNSYIFSKIQYKVAYLGKDKKVEKLRALYSLARTLMLCFGIFVIFIPVANLVPFLYDMLEPQHGLFANTFFATSLFLLWVFFLRMKKCNKYMALIMLGNYDASCKKT